MTWVHIWIGLSSFGVLLSIYLTNESWLDLRAFGLSFRWPFSRKVGWRWPIYFEDLSGNGSIRHAISRFLRETIRISVHVFYLIIAVPVWDRQVELTGTLAAFIWGNAALVINSLIDARTLRGSRRRRRGDRDETDIEQQDREVGDERRLRQAREKK